MTKFGYMPIKPIKRTEALLPLSREHHFDLLLAWKIRKGMKAGVAPSRIADYIRYLDEYLMTAHFADEEILLFDQLPKEDALCQRARREHHEIRDLIAGITGGEEDVSLFAKLADAVEAHVRFEERELFPYLEQQIPAGKQREIATELALNHDGFIEVWNDHFWNEPK